MLTIINKKNEFNAGRSDQEQTEEDLDQDFMVLMNNTDQQGDVLLRATFWAQKLK